MMAGPTLLAGCGIAFVSALLRRMTGMGFAMVSVPFLSLVISPASAVLVTIVLQLILGVRNVGFLTRHTQWRVLPVLMVVGLVAAPIGIWFTCVISEHFLRLFIGVSVMLGIVPILMNNKPRQTRNRVGLAVAGFLAGFLNGVAAMPAPPLLLYFMGRPDIDLEQRRATLITIFTLLGAISLASHAAAGLVDWPTLMFALVTGPATLLGDHFGRSTPWSFDRRVVDALSTAIVVISAATMIASTIR